MKFPFRPIRIAESTRQSTQIVPPRRSRQAMPYQLPPDPAKSAYVRTRFDAIAHRYDLFNDLITQGQHRRWKRVLIQRLELQKGARVLDLCCGTGDIALRCATRLGGQGQVVGLDFSPNMLRIAAARRASTGVEESIGFISGDAMALPFRANEFDAVTIGYGLRNVADIGVCLAEVVRVLKPGGMLASLDVGKTRPILLRPLVAFYFFRIVPLIGRLLLPGEEMFSYLPHSSVGYPHQDRLGAILADQGFTHVELIEFLGGASVIHIARKAGPL